MNNKTPAAALKRIEACRKTKITQLHLSNLGLTQIPQEVQELTWLESLWLGGNQISKIENLDKLNNLTTLWLSSNQISKIENLDKLNNLTELSLSFNQISKIENLDKLNNLTTLLLIGNQISKIENLEKLNNLTELRLGSNQISKIEKLNELNELIFLSLYNNQISKIEKLNELNELIFLSLDHNQISKIENLEKLNNLTTLWLSSNQISKIENLDKLNNLTELRLGSNQINKIENLEKVTSLTELRLDSNQIKNIEPLLPFAYRGINVYYAGQKFADKNGIYLDKNPIEIPDIETVKRGTEAILAYFEERDKRKQLVKDNFSKIPSVKLILFGNSNAGKTNLCKYLMTNQFDEGVRDSTHGVLIENWVKPNDEKLIAHIWDFGGQEYYHGAYRLFMSHKTVFVVVWEKETNQNFGQKKTLIKKNKDGSAEYEDITHFELQYWLDSIAHYAPESPILLVQNKVDRLEDKQRHLPDLFEYYEIVDDFAISLKMGSKAANHANFRHLQHFKQELIALLKENTYHDQTLTRLKLRDVLIDLQEADTEKDNPFIAYKDKLEISVADFEAIMGTQTVDVTLSNPYEVLDWLHTRGIVLYYKNNITLDEKAFLQPKKIIDLIYDILNKKVLQNDGIITFEDIKNKEVSTEDIIALMQEMDIIFKVPNQENEYIAPQYLPEQHPLQDLYEIAADEIKQSSYSVKLPLFYYRRVMQALILHYGKNQDANCKAYFWKHGILVKKDNIRLLIKGLYPNENESEGIIMVATDKKGAYIKLQKRVFSNIRDIVNGFDVNEDFYEEKDETLNINMAKTKFLSQDDIIAMLKNTNNDAKKDYFPLSLIYGKSIYDRIEVSTDGIHFITYTALLDAAENDEQKVKAIDKDKNVKYLITNDFKAMLDESTLPKRPLKVFISYAHKDGEYLNLIQAHLRNLRRKDMIDTWSDRKVIAGELWDERILKELREADIVIMLMSAYFLDSDYVWEKELEIALNDNSKKRLLLPIFVRPFDFHDLTWKPTKETLEKDESNLIESFNLSSIQWLPFNANGKLQAISTWSDKDEALSEVAKKIREAITSFTPHD